VSRNLQCNDQFTCISNLLLSVAVKDKTVENRSIFDETRNYEVIEIGGLAFHGLPTVRFFHNNIICT